MQLDVMMGAFPCSPHLAEALQHLLVSLVAAVAEVEARHVQARIQQVPQVGLAPALGAHGADDLGLADQPLLLLQNHAQRHRGGTLRVHIGRLLRNVRKRANVRVPPADGMCTHAHVGADQVGLSRS